MNACCETPVFEPPVAPPREGALQTVVLIGPPNSGKSTLFNRLTGLRQKVANYPGVTVEQRMGLMAGVGREDLTLIDLPGIYSLTPYSEDARVAVNVLRGRMPGTPKPDAVLLVLDSLHLTRQLMLAAPVLAVGLPTLVLLNMSDLMESRGGQIDTLKLARELGAPVAQISAVNGTGLDAVPLFLNQQNGHGPDHATSAHSARRRQRRQHAYLGRAGQPPHRLPGAALGRKHAQASTTCCCTASGDRCCSCSSSLASSKSSSPSASRSPTALATCWRASPTSRARFCPSAGCNRSCSTACGRASAPCSSSSPRFFCSSSSSASSKTPAISPARRSSPTASCAPSASTARPSSRCFRPTPAPSRPSWPRAPSRTSATASPPFSSRPS